MDGHLQLPLVMRPVACTDFLKGRSGKKKKGKYSTLARVLAADRTLEGTLAGVLAALRALKHKFWFPIGYLRAV